MSHRSFLVNIGLIATPEMARSQFWILKDNWWKQIIDASDHKHGQWVFDKGLHGHGAELGFYDGILRGSKYLMDRIGDEFNINTYKGTHHMACSHFDGNRNGVLCEAYEVDRFRTQNIYCNERKSITSDGEYAREYSTKIRQEISAIAINIKARRPFATCLHSEEAYMIMYLDYESEKECEELTIEIIKQYNENMNALYQILRHKYDDGVAFDELKKHYNYQTISNIAKLYATLEWQHPWRDGQGRTDLIILNGLLCKEGLTSVFLWDPYYSTYNTIGDWITYLRYNLAMFPGKIKENNSLSKSHNLEMHPENHLLIKSDNSQSKNSINSCVLI